LAGGIGGLGHVGLSCSFPSWRGWAMKIIQEKSFNAEDTERSEKS
jgi:hypothetical protein